MRSAVLFWVGILFCSCSSQKEGQTYDPNSHLYAPPGETTGTWHDDLNELKQPSPPRTMEFTSWTFSLEQSEWQSAEPKTKVNLPHRINAPNTPLRYESQLNVPVAGKLIISADDGAQVMIDGHRVFSEPANTFAISAGSHNVVIRVLNNAMAGGLREASFCDEHSYHQYLEHRSRYLRTRTVLEKGILLRNKEAKLEVIIDNLIATRSDSCLIQAEEVLKDFPLLTTPSLVFHDENVTRISTISSGSHPVILEWGEDSARFQAMMQHPDQPVFTLSGLKPGTTYYYRLRSSKTITRFYSFKTAANQREFSFNAWADSQSGWAAFSQNMQNIIAHRDVFGIGIGDLVGDGSNSVEWEEFFSLLSSSASHIFYYLIGGNHDYDGYYDTHKPENLLRYSGNKAPWFGWRYGNCAFIALDPNCNFPVGLGDEQTRWLMDELKTDQWRTADWRFILVHQPPYSRGWKGYEGEISLRNVIEPLISEHKVDFILSGHTHDYERLTRKYGSQEVTFFVLGGAGGGLEPVESSDEPKMDTVIKQHHIGRFFVSEREVVFRAYNLENEVVDSFRVQKPTSARAESLQY